MFLFFSYKSYEFVGKIRWADFRRTSSWQRSTGDFHPFTILQSSSVFASAPVFRSVDGWHGLTWESFSAQVLDSRHPPEHLKFWLPLAEVQVGPQIDSGFCIYCEEVNQTQKLELIKPNQEGMNGFFIIHRISAEYRITFPVLHLSGASISSYHLLHFFESDDPFGPNPGPQRRECSHAGHSKIRDARIERCLMHVTSKPLS